MKRNVKFLLVTLVVAFTFFSCDKNEDESQPAKQLKADSETIENYLTTNNITNTKVIDGIYKENLVAGSGVDISPSKVIEVSIRLRKFDTNEEFYSDVSYIYTPNYGFYLEGVVGNFVGLNESVKSMEIGDKADFYIASGYMFGTTNGDFDDVTINTNQIAIAQIELKDERTFDEQDDYEDEIIKSLLQVGGLTNEDSLTNGVYRVITVEGTGDAVTTSTSVVNVEYKGKFINGDIFDENVNATFAIETLIEGWKTGLIGLKKGTSLLIFVPSRMAYDERGIFNDQGYVAIPSYETLVFEVKLLNF